MTRIISLTETTDPTAVADQAILYARDVSGVTQAFFRASDGTITQISTPAPTGTLLGRQVFTASGTYTPTAGTRMVRVRMVAGGGGGGGVQVTAGAYAAAGGGASGVYWEKLIDPGALVTGGAVAIGAAGAAGSNTGGTGGTGGDTTVVIQGTTYTAKGGLGGVGNSGTNINVIIGAAGGAVGAGSSAGDIAFGQDGERSTLRQEVLTTGLVAGWSGEGGSGPFGAGGRKVASGFAGVPGLAGVGNGAGGSGAAGVDDGFGGGAEVGGVGTIGLIIIEEYSQGSLAVSLGTANTWTKSQNVARVALTDAANIATDSSLGNVFSVTLAGNRTLDNPTNLVDGGTYSWIVTQDGTGSRTLAYGALFKWPGGTVPVLSTAAGAVDLITAVYNGTILAASINKAFA